MPLDGSPVSSYRLKGPEGVTVFDLGASLDPGGRFLAVSTHAFGHPELNAIRILDLATSEEQTLDTRPEGAERCQEPGSESSGAAVPVWLRDGRLVSDGDAGLRLWSLANGTSRSLRACREILPSGGLQLHATPDSRTILRLQQAIRPEDTSSLSLFDLVTSTTREMRSHVGRRSCRQ